MSKIIDDEKDRKFWIEETVYAKVLRWERGC